MAKAQRFPTREQVLARLEEERALVQFVMDEYRNRARCGCLPQPGALPTNRPWAKFQFEFLGTHAPGCPLGTQHP